MGVAKARIRVSKPTDRREIIELRFYDAGSDVPRTEEMNIMLARNLLSALTAVITGRRTKQTAEDAIRPQDRGTVNLGAGPFE